MRTLYLQLPMAEKGKRSWGGHFVTCSLMGQTEGPQEQPPAPRFLAGKDWERRRKTVYFSTHSGTGRFSKEQSLASF